MKRFILATLLPVAAAIASAAPSPSFTSVSQLADLLAAIERYDASATYSVMLPSATDDIVYSIDLQSLSCPSDTLSECDYLIEWSLPTPSGLSSGFSSYSNGSHFRYRDSRMQEYHFDWDSIPFLTGRGGVQRNAQFVDILPQYLASQLRVMEADTTYRVNFNPDAIYSGRRVARVDAVETVGGLTAREITMMFDAASGMPLRLEYEYNPGSISEQTVTVEYEAPVKEPVELFSEDMLVKRYPDIFDRFRQSNFRAENMPGTDLPPFALPTLTGERYSRSRGEGFPSPVIVALLDPSVETNHDTIASLREAVSMLPFAVDIIWAFTGSNIDTIENQTGTPSRIGETTLISAKSLARDTGVTSFPALFFVDRNGIVRDVQLGYNKSLSGIVIQKTSLLN